MRATLRLILNSDYKREYKEHTIIVTSERIDTVISSHKVGEKTDELDMVLRINRDIICNIEVDTNYSVRCSTKSFGYLANIYVESRKNYKTVLQFDLARGIPEKFRRQKRKVYYHSNDNFVNIRNFVSYLIDIDYVLKFWYDDDEQGISKYAFLIMLTLGKDDLVKLSKCEYLTEEDRYYVSKFGRRVIDMNKRDTITLYFTREEANEYVHQLELEDAREAGVKEGKALGHSEGLIEGRNEGLVLGEQIGTEKAQNEMVSKMLSDGVNRDFIKKYVNMPLEKIREIESSIHAV